MIKKILVPAIFCLQVVVHAQLPPTDPADAFGAHLFSTIQVPETEALGRGIGVMIPDMWSGNPAHLAWFKWRLKEVRGAYLHQFVKSESQDGDISMGSLKVAFPVGPKTVIFLNGASLKSGAAVVATMPAPVGNLRAQMRENDVSILLGHRLSNEWSVGMAVSPEMDVKMNISSDAIGPLASINTYPLWGGRFGFQGKLKKGWLVGGFLDYQIETAKTNLVLPVPTTITNHFRTDVQRVGVAKRIGSVVVGVERYHLTLDGAGAKRKIQQWALGSELAVVDTNRTLVIRIGSNDGHKLSVGLGLKLGERFDLRLAHARGLFAKQFASSFRNPSVTQLTLEYRF